MKVFRGPVPKQGNRAKKKRRGMARPDQPLAPYCEVARVDICTASAEIRMIGSLIAVLFWVVFVAVIRHETRAQRAEWAAMREFDEWREALR